MKTGHVMHAGSLVVIAVALCLSPIASQGEEITLKGRNVSQKSESTWAQVGDNEAHGVGTYENQGLTFLEDGRVATYTNRGAYESKEGRGRHRGYLVKTFADGSTYVSSYKGTSWPANEGRRDMQGSAAILSGSGKFAGIKGEGTYKGTLYPNGMSVIDYEIRATVPD